MADKEKESTTSVGLGSPFTDYANGIARYYMAPHLIRSFPVRTDGDIVSTALDYTYEDSGDGGEGEVEDPEKKDPPVKKTNPRKSPTLIDIKLVDKTIVYDASGNPSVTVVFKIRNSSGEPVIGIKALVTKR